MRTKRPSGARGRSVGIFFLPPSWEVRLRARLRQDLEEAVERRMRERDD
jgi:guanylate kinase